MKRKIIICLLISIIIILFSLFLIKFITINSFLKKVSNNFNITNYQFELIKNNENINPTSHRYLKKDSTLLIIPNDKVRIYMINNGNNSVLGLTIDEINKTVNKTVLQNSEYLSLSGNLKQNYSFIEKIKMCFNWKISYEKINEIDCIVITDENNNVTYYNKENAYLVKNNNFGEVKNMQLNSVTENDVALPNLDEYTEI